MLDPTIPIEPNYLITLITYVITVPLSALVLFLVGKIFKEELGYGKSLIAALISPVVGILISLPNSLISSPVLMIVIGVISFLIGGAVHLTVPKFIFGLEWKRGLLIGVVWWVVMIILGMITGLIIGTIMAVFIAFN